MRRLIDKITNLGTVTVGFCSIIAMLGLCNICIVGAIEELIDVVRETNQANESVVMSYEEPEEEIVVPVYYEKQEDGDMIYEFGDVCDDAYFFIIINEEQGVYDYYWPTMSEDWPLSYNSLSELQESVICHIDQEWHNARFVIEWD